MLPLSRREMLARCGTGIGTIALTGVLADDGSVAHASGSSKHEALDDGSVRTIPP